MDIIVHDISARVNYPCHEITVSIRTNTREVADIAVGQIVRHLEEDAGFYINKEVRRKMGEPRDEKTHDYNVPGS